jgi:hypothetical protein
MRNLSQNTRYYFRACGENRRGDLVDGAVRSFRTDSVQAEDPARVYTKIATYIEKYSAQLNGYVDINDTKNGKVYFVYGKSPSYMVMKTGELAVVSNTAFQSIAGLEPNTTYYYQAVVKDNNGVVDRGVIKNFRTKVSYVKVPVNGLCSTRVNKCVRGYYQHVLDSKTYRK